jgi:hypothetical protein
MQDWASQICFATSREYKNQIQPSFSSFPVSKFSLPLLSSKQAKEFRGARTARELRAAAAAEGAAEGGASEERLYARHGLAFHNSHLCLLLPSSSASLHACLCTEAHLGRAAQSSTCEIPREGGAGCPECLLRCVLFSTVCLFNCRCSGCTMSTITVPLVNHSYHYRCLTPPFLLCTVGNIQEAARPSF